MLSRTDGPDLRHRQSSLAEPPRTHSPSPKAPAPAQRRPELLDVPKDDCSDSVEGPSRSATWAKLARADSVYRRWGSRALDLGLLVVALPLAFVVAVPITLLNWLYFRKLGLVLFTQPRVGRHGRTFQILKFRTLQVGSHENFESWIGGEDAERTTGLGRILRSTHLDELPQLLNILAGHMSFVGPRPEMVAIHHWAADRIPGFERRLALRPGLTGLSQLTLGYADGKVDAYRAKLACDLVWMRGRSLRGDVLLLLRTVPWSFRRRGGTAGDEARDAERESTAPSN